MSNEPTTEPVAGSAWQAKQVYVMAVISLAVGLAIGYLFRGSQSPAPAPQPVAAAQQSPAAGGMGGAPGQMPTLEQMKQMADQKAAPLLEKLKSDPNNTDLLNQIGGVYVLSHRFKEAAGYFDRVLQVDPKNVAARTQLASCLYYTGDVDGAISQLQQSLRYDPKDANSLFVLGMIKWQGKQDSKGAVATWQQLLKLNPQLSPDRKANLQKLIANVQNHPKS
jgi:cytochrome c-type biogenesis protein CcmH/NrfG